VWASQRSLRGALNARVNTISRSDGVVNIDAPTLLAALAVAMIFSLPLNVVDNHVSVFPSGCAVDIVKATHHGAIFLLQEEGIENRVPNEAFD